MSNFKVKYASEVHLDRDWAFAPGQWFKFDWQTLQDNFPDPQCYLVALNDQQINILLHMASIFPKFYRNWGFDQKSLWSESQIAMWDSIETFVSEMELCLMSGCNVGDLLTAVQQTNSNLANIDRAIRYLTATIGSQAVDFTIPIPDQINLTQTGIAYALYDDQGERLANFIDQIEENLVGINGNLVLVRSELAAVNGTLNESFNLDTEGGLTNNINDRLKNLNITLGSYEGFDLPGIIESLSELSRIRASLETVVVTNEGVERQGIATTLQEQSDNLAFILDRIRDNLDLSVFDNQELTIKEYSITSALFTRISEFIEVVDKIRDNLDAIIDTDTEMGLAGMIDALNLTAARINNSLRCVADAMNAICPAAPDEPPYLRSGDFETKVSDDDWLAELRQLREDLINDESEGRVPFVDETDEDMHIADGTFTLVQIEHTAGDEPNTGFLTIDVSTNGKCELIFQVQGTNRLSITSFSLPQEQFVMRHIPDTGTLIVLNERTNDTTSVNW